MPDIKKNHFPIFSVLLLDREHISWYKTCEVRLNCIESQGYYGACQYESGLKLRTYFQLFGEDFHLKWSLFRETAKCSRKPLNAVRLLQGFPGFTLRNISLKLEVSKLDMQKISCTEQFKEMKALNLRLAAFLHTKDVWITTTGATMDYPIFQKPEGNMPSHNSCIANPNKKICQTTL